MTRARPVRRVLIVLALIAGPLAVFLAWQLSWNKSSPPKAPVVFAPPVHAVDFKRQTIYHSPQTPGYTAWVGAWTNPDGSLMTAFTQATGPISPSARGLAPPSTWRALGFTSWNPRLDFWNLSLGIKYLRSTDGGAKWNVVRTDSFKALYPHGYTPQATIALKDGTLIRRVNGADLKYYSGIPHTAFLQRLAPGAKDWSAPQNPLDPARYSYQITRIRYLRDGRLIATGVYSATPSTAPSKKNGPPSKLLVLVSSDEGKTWKIALTESASQAEQAPGNEWDAAELPNGDLVGVMRTFDHAGSKHKVLKQAILKKNGDGWVMTDVAPFPAKVSGHPELLKTREGPVLYISQTGILYTRNGVDWQQLKFVPPQESYNSGYYPRSVQTKDGVIHVFGHIGYDDPYGARDQSIIEDEFKLARDRPAAPGG